ncbi:MAG TPA: BREX system ATP-binding domain-containing protein [Candidatus Eisenbacteria bacterium]|nr:BREX system ATP-binding domain-containing protein [Candidatus Eisenbacteria bacterium]
MNEASDGWRAGRAIVGRDRELALVEHALDEALAGRGKVIVVRGASGHGKTRFAREVAGLAVERGMQVVWRSITASDTAPLVSDRATAESPLALFLDDLHAADEATLARFVAAARELSAVPGLVLGTIVDPVPSGEAQRRIAEIEAHAVCVRLGPLPVGAVITLAGQAGVDAPARALERLLVATGGNAFLVVEALDALARAGRIVETEPWPMSDRAVAWMRGRLAALPAGSRDAVEAASVLGEACDTKTIARVLGDPGALRALEESLLMSTVNGSGRRRFTPPLARDLVHASLPAERRAELHIRAAAVLATEDESATAALVHRCLAAMAMGDARGAEVHLRRLADLASEARARDFASARVPGAPYLVCEGEYWAIGFADRAVRLGDRAGLVYLAHLLARPGVEVPALDLVGSARGDAVPAMAESPLVAERARVSVTRRIRDAIDRLAEAHPELGTHLNRTIRTGTRCSYLVDPAAAPRWDVRCSR